VTSNHATATTAKLAIGLRQAGLLLLLAAGVAVVAWLSRPEKVALRADPAFYRLELDAPLLATADALDLYTAGRHLFLDTRAVAPGSVATIPGAIPVRAAHFDQDLYENREFLYPEDPVVLFGDGNLLAVSTVAARLRERGFAEITIMAGGLDAWRRSGGPLSEPDGGRHE
jgi:rhodanese-related sulfurtransferase